MLLTTAYHRLPGRAPTAYHVGSGRAPTAYQREPPAPLIAKAVDTTEGQVESGGRQLDMECLLLAQVSSQTLSYSAKRAQQGSQLHQRRVHIVGVQEVLLKKPPLGAVCTFHVCRSAATDAGLCGCENLDFQLCCVCILQRCLEACYFGPYFWCPYPAAQACHTATDGGALHVHRNNPCPARCRSLRCFLVARDGAARPQHCSQPTWLLLGDVSAKLPARSTEVPGGCGYGEGSAAGKPFLNFALATGLRVLNSFAGVHRGDLLDGTDYLSVPVAFASGLSEHAPAQIDFLLATGDVLCQPASMQAWREFNMASVCLDRLPLSANVKPPSRPPQACPHATGRLLLPRQRTNPESVDLFARLLFAMPPAPCDAEPTSRCHIVAIFVARAGAIASGAPRPKPRQRYMLDSTFALVEQRGRLLSRAHRVGTDALGSCVLLFRGMGPQSVACTLPPRRRSARCAQVDAVEPCACMRPRRPPPHLRAFVFAIGVSCPCG